MCHASLREAVARVPSGGWAIGVSGGADSVALLDLLRARTDLSLHVGHLDHETRGGESAADAEFVRSLASQWNLPATIQRRSDVEKHLARVEKNLSARFRAARLELFRQVVQAQKLDGVIFAHHADDQAETVLQRLIRGAGRAGLAGMSPRVRIGGVVIFRPLLGVRRAALRSLLQQRSIAWREDVSNRSPAQQRNRARQLLASHPGLSECLIELGSACETLTQWIRAASPHLGDTFDVSELQRLSPPLAREAARRWLSDRAGADVEITPAAIQRLLDMALDAASPARQDFPGGLTVRRRNGRISVQG